MFSVCDLYIDQVFESLLFFYSCTSYYTEDFSQGVMVSCNGFFFNVVCCQVSTNNVHSYQLSCGLDYIALCHVIAYVCFFICSSLLFNYLFFYLFNYV